MSLMLITPASEEPISLEVVKAHARITHGSEDQLLGQLLRAARAHLEWATGWSLAEQVWQQDMCASSSGESVFLRKPFISFTSAFLFQPDSAPVEIDLEGLVLTSQSLLNTRIISALKNNAYLRIQYRAGPGVAGLPADLHQALLILTAYLYENRDSFREPANAAKAAGILPLIAPYREVFL